MEKRIVYGLRRLTIASIVMGGLGVGFFIWAQYVTKPTFIFPLGMLAPEHARIALTVVAVLSVGYVAAVNYVRHVNKPAVIIKSKSIVIPMGDFAASRVEIRAGEVRGLREETKTSGWKVTHIDLGGRKVRIASSMLPTDEDYELVRGKLEALKEGKSPKAQ